MDEIQKIVQCRACGSPKLKKFFDLGKQPLANSLLHDLDEKEKKYPLSLSWCERCFLAQLDYTVNPAILFSSYVWVTGTSKVAHEYRERFYQEVEKRLIGSRKGYVLEIASNDGTFLEPFQRAGHAVLGIDPAANIAERANAAGIPTECAFFGSTYAKDVVKRRGKARVVFARNVLPHVADPRDFVKGIAASVANDGIAVVEVHDASTIIEELQYDSIYHEHLCYFTFTTLSRLLRSNGLFIFDMTRSPISGGSMVVFAKTALSKESLAVIECKKREKDFEVNTFIHWNYFARRAAAHRQSLRNMIGSTLRSKKRIVGYGASARSSTLLNFCGIDRTQIPVIADKNPLKQALYTAGTRIPIQSPERIFGKGKNPHEVLLLAWNFEEEIKEYLAREFGFSGSYIIPLPGMPRFERKARL